MKKLAVSGAIGCALFVFYLAVVNYLEPYQVGIARNLVSGEVILQNPGKDRGGFYFTAPWVQVARVDTRPMRVCITSSARAFRCQLVQFEPAGYREFVATQGWRYYWWANRLSFNFGYNEEYRGVKDILRGYAFGTEKYPFLSVLNEYAE